jgi:hypothetical protein
MVTPALVVRRYWSEIFVVCELFAFQHFSFVGERFAFVVLAVDKVPLR